ncbi:unnamed protein product [Cunninghamella blakesleeana]
MTNHLYILDLKTLIWTRHIPPPDSDKAPSPRYFHTTNVYGHSLIIFGGMGYSRQSADGLCVLDDIAVFDVDTLSWNHPNIQPSLFAPRPRYAHLATISDNNLLVIGGQDMNNVYLTEINILNLESYEWTHATNFDQNVGAYRSIAIATDMGTSLPVPLMNNQSTQDNHIGNDSGQDKDYNSSRNRMSLLYADLDTNPNIDIPGPVFLYSNYNFADVNRELQLITRSSPSETSFSNKGTSISFENASKLMTGSSMPPGLRFPTGEVIGQHLIIAGTYLSPQTQSYSLWGLNIASLVWTRIDSGSIFGSGSWNRGVLHSSYNRYLVFGNINRNLLEDYNHRQVNFDHIASIDLEAYGIYQHPKVSCSPLAQEMGLRLLNEPTVADFSIITRENQEIAVNSAILRHRWPYFAQLLKEAKNGKQNETSKLDKIQEETNENSNNKENELPNHQSDETKHDDINSSIEFTANACSMSFPYVYPVVVALLQYLYTDNLLTAQQYQPHILSQLLLLADMYNLPRLVTLATHALHQMLNMSTAPLIFETAALSHQTSLQVRALKLMIAAKKMVQQQQQRSSQYVTSEYNYQHQNTSLDGNANDKDWDLSSMSSSGLQQQMDTASFQSLSNPQHNSFSNQSFSNSTYSSLPTSFRSSDLEFKQNHLSPTLGPYQGKGSSASSKSMASTSLSSSTNSSFHNGRSNSNSIASTLPARPSTSLNQYGLLSNRLQNINQTTGQLSSSVYQSANSPVGSQYSDSVKSSNFPFSGNVGNNANSTIAEDDALSVSSFSAYGNASSSSKDSIHKKRKEYRFLNALGNKFSISRS